MPPGARLSRPHFFTSCWRGLTATTICPTARICATRAHRWLCQRRSVCRSAPWIWTTSNTRTAYSSLGRMSGTNSPRMLHQLQDARQRGVPIVTFNPLRERGLVSFTNPLSVPQMALGLETQISTQYHQVRIGGDIAAVTGICKALLEADDRAVAGGKPRVLDVEFIEQHTHGLGGLRSSMFTAAVGTTLKASLDCGALRSRRRLTNMPGPTG